MADGALLSSTAKGIARSQLDCLAQRQSSSAEAQHRVRSKMNSPGPGDGSIGASARVSHARDRDALEMHRSGDGQLNPTRHPGRLRRVVTSPVAPPRDRADQTTTIQLKEGMSSSSTASRPCQQTTSQNSDRGAPVSATPEPDPRAPGPGQPRRARLTRVQQLDLNVWRHAAASVARKVPPDDVLAHVAVQGVLAVLRDTTDPIELFARHHNGEHEYGFVVSIAGQRSTDELLNLIDSGYLLRWHELTSDGRGPEELPPLRPRSGPQRLFG